MITSTRLPVPDRPNLFNFDPVFATSMEYRIANRVVSRHDFQEGVRAVIVEKDNAPKGSPETLSGVTVAMLDEIFAPLDGGELDFED